jgi:Putative Flp pilus-assembly TadE/G-like
MNHPLVRAFATALAAAVPIPSRARRWKPTVRSERGQAIVLMAAFLPVLLGAAALVLDVGSWYRADRAAQAAADASALAGAQGLQAGTDVAAVLADEYAVKNGGGDKEISFSTKVVPNDLITVTVKRPAPGFFTKLFGVDSVTVNARATARSGVPGRARYVAPIAVNEQHPMLQCGCFDDPTQVTLINLHNPGDGDAAGAFGLINLQSQTDGSGNIGSDQLGAWIRDGYQDALPLGTYDSAPSANFNSDNIRIALRDRVDTELLFPVYRPPITGSGSGAEFDIIGWVGFVPTSFTLGGSTGEIRGYFTKVIWQGLADDTGNVPDFGVRVISLIE